MGLSYFVHLHGDPAHAADLCAEAEHKLKDLKASLDARCSVLLHAPLAVSGNDPLPVAQDARMLLCQVYCPDDGKIANAAADAMAASLSELAQAKGVKNIHAHAMTTEWLRPGSPEDPAAPEKAVSFFVQYDGPAEDPNAFHTYYRDHHVPIVFRMPGIRSVSYYLPTSAKGPAIGQQVQRLQIVQAVFDSADEFLKMRQSGERKEGLRDFDNYPKFEGPVTHQVMNSKRL